MMERSSKHMQDSAKKWQLTTAQQELVAENEYIITHVFNKLHLYDNYADDVYGAAAIGLCEAAKFYNKNNELPFYPVAFTYIKFKIFKEYNHKQKEQKALGGTLSLNQPGIEGADELESVIPAPDEWEALEYKILADSLYQKVEHVLTFKEKEVFLRWLHGETNSDIARTEGMSRASISLRILSARNKCRTFFKADEIFS
jgi:RNA polymerase sigma factor (sigma-70 family)